MNKVQSVYFETWAYSLDNELFNQLCLCFMWQKELEDVYAKLLDVTTRKGQGQPRQTDSQEYNNPARLRSSSSNFQPYPMVNKTHKSHSQSHTHNPDYYHSTSKHRRYEVTSTDNAAINACMKYMHYASFSFC